MPSLRYKKPYLVNAYEFSEKPSPDGTLPSDSLTGATLYPNGPDLELLSDTSEEVDSQAEEVEAEEAWESESLADSANTVQREAFENDKAYKRDNPLASLPDASKFDKVFILPLFCKPGKHQYMVKYKDTQEHK